MSKIKINKDLLQALCGLQSTEEEICSILETDFETLKLWVKKEYKKDWDSFYNQFSAKGKVKIRENQINLSRKSPEMAKHLGEKYLNDDKNEQNIAEPTQNEVKVSQKVMGSLQKDPKFLNLKLQHRSFLLNYLVCKNATESALRAEYPKTSAYSQGGRLMNNARIASLIAKYSNMEADLAGDEKEKLIEQLHFIKDKAMETFIYPGMPGAAISAIKQISSMRGFEAPKEIKGTLSIIDVLKAQEGEETIDL